MTREIDRLVAEKVLGRTPETHPERYWFKHTGTEEPAEAVWPEWTRLLSGPPFSEDIGAVFAEVIPAMREKGWHLTLADSAKLSPKGTERGWVAKFRQKQHHKLEFADSPAEAICLAALRAVGVGVGE